MSDLKHITQKIQDRLTQKQVKNFEIYIQSKEGLSLEVLKGKREAFEAKNSLGFGLRVIKDQRLGFSYGTDFSESAIDFVIDQCVQSLAQKPQDPFLTFVNPQKLPENLNLLDEGLKTVSTKEKLNAAIAMESAAYASGSQIKNVRSASYDDEIETTVIMNSLGLDAQQVRSLTSLSMMAIAEEEGLSEAGYDHQTEVCFSKLNPSKVGKGAAAEALSSLGGKPIANYVGPVIVNHSVVASLLGVLGPSFFGENLAKSHSFLIGKKGQKVYSSNLNIIDDGLLNNGSGSNYFDGEGTPQQRKVLVQDGVIQGFLYDSYWGARAQECSTGNAHRSSCLSLPKLSYSNFHIPAGQQSLDQLLATLNSGVLITDLIGIHTADSVSGNFSVGMQGIWIENGKKQRAIRSVALSGNLHELLNQVQAVGSDLKFFGRVGAPSLLLGKAEISGK